MYVPSKLDYLFVSFKKNLDRFTNAIISVIASKTLTSVVTLGYKRSAGFFNHFYTFLTDILAANH